MGGGRHYFMCTLHSVSMMSNGCTQWATGAYFYSLWFFTETQLRIHNLENKILIQYHIVWHLVVIFSQRATREDFPKDPLLFLSTLALMPLSLLVEHSYWKSLQTALEEFLSMDLTCYQRRLDSLWEKKSIVQHIGVQYMYSTCPSPPVSSFGSCGHHISILFSQLSIPSCIVVKIATGSALAHRVQPFYVIRKLAPPHSPKYV